MSTRFFTQEAVKVFNSLLAAFVIATMAVVFSISFAALIYQGPLANFLAQGIGVTLFGAIILGAFGGFLFSYRGTISGPQDVTCILLAGSAGTISALLHISDPNAVFATVVVFIGLASIISGVAALVCAKLQLGYLVRFIPYPVIGGFLAATGYLLATSGLGLMIRTDASISSLLVAIVEINIWIWLPWTFSALVIVVFARRGFGNFSLPVVMTVSVTVLYVILNIEEISLLQAQSTGLLLGPFEPLTFTSAADFNIWTDIRWNAIAKQSPTIIVIAGLTVLGTLLNSTGLEMAIGQDNDSKQDLHATGLTNVAAGLVGGLPGYQLFGETLLARQFGLLGPVAGLTAAAGCLLALVFGTSFLGYIPVGVPAMLIMYLGFDLLATWLWDERQRLSPRDYCIIVLMVVTAAFVGFLEALVVGIGAAVVIFVVSYARLDVVRMRSTAATRRSRVERSDTDLALLEQDGKSVVVFELSGYIFFGTANALSESIKHEFKTGRPPKQIIVDFAQVKGVDASATFALNKMVNSCLEHNVICVFSAMNADLEKQYLRTNSNSGQARLDPSLDRALENYETSMLEEIDGQSDTRSHCELLDFVEDVLRSDTLPAAVSVVSLAQDDVLMAEGSNSSDIFILKTGSMRAQVSGPNGKAIVVARFLPGALIGEIAFYAGVARTATVIAEKSCTVYKLQPGDLAAQTNDKIGTFHSLVASYMSRRVIRMSRLLREAGL